MFSRRPDVRLNRGRVQSKPGTPAAPPSYSPADEGGLVLWVDPHDASTYTIDGSNNFTDLKNKVTGVSLTITSDPNLDPVAINGVPGIALDSTDWFTGSEAAVLAVGTNGAPWTVFTVLSGSGDFTRTYFGWGNSGAASANRFVLLTSGTGTGRWGAYGENSSSATTVFAEDTAAFDANPHILCWRYDGSNLSLIVDNVARTLSATAFAPGTLTPNRYALGVGPWSTLQQPWTAALGDHLVYNSVLSAAAITRVAQYLGAKYSITV